MQKYNGFNVLDYLSLFIDFKKCKLYRSEFKNLPENVTKLKPHYFNSIHLFNMLNSLHAA